MIDLHLHTTASDGLLSPAALVARAAGAGLRTISITDHDTVAGLDEGAAAAARAGLALVPGIEVTAVEDGRDVHLLGYFFDPRHGALTAFLRAQRQDRIRRVREMGARLVSLGCGIDVDPLLEQARLTGRSIGRPALADALVAAGHAASREDAFARLLARGGPAFVPRRGAAGALVIETIHAAGGIVSLAHPGLLRDDVLVSRLADGGLDALEVWHSDHSPAQQEQYRQLAAVRGLAMSGGSDFHGDGVHGGCVLGGATLPAVEFARLCRSAGRAA